jgi:hypothetical protein
LWKDAVSEKAAKYAAEMDIKKLNYKMHWTGSGQFSVLDSYAARDALSFSVSFHSLSIYGT